MTSKTILFANKPEVTICIYLKYKGSHNIYTVLYKKNVNGSRYNLIYVLMHFIIYMMAFSLSTYIYLPTSLKIRFFFFPTFLYTSLFSSYVMKLMMRLGLKKMKWKIEEIGNKNIYIKKAYHVIIHIPGHRPSHNTYLARFIFLLLLV